MQTHIMLLQANFIKPGCALGNDRPKSGTRSTSGKAWRMPGACGLFLGERWMLVYSGRLDRLKKSSNTLGFTVSTRIPGRAASFLALPLPAGMHTIPTFFTISEHLVHPLPPCQPHPSPSVLKGLLAAHEAVLGVRRAGPDPLVSPRLKGSDYMEN